MHIWRLAAGLVLIFSSACEPSVSDTTVPLEHPSLEVDGLGSAKVRGQKVYVPIYSSIKTSTASGYLHLTSILSIRNISPSQSIIVSVVDYFDTNGKLIKNYLRKPISLPPLATKEFAIEEFDTIGGTGANFIVDWESDKEVAIPIIESVMFSSTTNKGISFVSRGKEIEHF